MIRCGDGAMRSMIRYEDGGMRSMVRWRFDEMMVGCDAIGHGGMRSAIDDTLRT